MYNEMAYLVLGEVSATAQAVANTVKRVVILLATVVARAPLSELLGYATALRSATAGEATFALEYAHHAPR